MTDQDRDHRVEIAEALAYVFLVLSPVVILLCSVYGAVGMYREYGLVGLPAWGVILGLVYLWAYKIPRVLDRKISTETK